MLGVPRDAEPRAIKDAFRALALKFHPDRNKEAGAEERFKEIAAAYAVLSDPKKCAEYDAGGHAGVAGYSAEDLFGGIDFQDLFGGLNLGFNFGGGLFDTFFQRRRGPPQGVNIEVDIVIPLEKVAKGGEETVRYPRYAPCLRCHGHGTASGAASELSMSPCLTLLPPPKKWQAPQVSRLVLPTFWATCCRSTGLAILPEPGGDST